MPPDNILSQVVYSVTSENGGHVKKGDQVEITAVLPFQLTEQGYVLTSEVKEVTCQKAAAYLTSLDEIDENTCVSCGACADACPVSAISEGDGKYEIDADACLDCGTCADTCPTGSIEQE